MRSLAAVNRSTSALALRAAKSVRHWAANQAMGYATNGSVRRARAFGRVAAVMDRYLRSAYAMTWPEWKRVLESYRRAGR